MTKLVATAHIPLRVNHYRSENEECVVIHLPLDWIEKPAVEIDQGGADGIMQIMPVTLSKNKGSVSNTKRVYTVRKQHNFPLTKGWYYAPAYLYEDGGVTILAAQATPANVKGKHPHVPIRSLRLAPTEAEEQKEQEKLISLVKQETHAGSLVEDTLKDVRAPRNKEQVEQKIVSCVSYLNNLSDNYIMSLEEDGKLAVSLKISRKIA